jgi:Transposase.
LTCRKPRANDNEVLKQHFYSKIPSRDIADVLRLIDGECNFLSAFTPLQPRYAKQADKKEKLIAVLMAQATNRSNFNMAEICDIPYFDLETTYEQCFRLATLKEANDLISDKIAKLPIFSDYSLDLIDLYSAVDGQKYTTRRPTAKARHSKKYFGKGLGVVAYTHLCNHIPLQTNMIGAHDPESYFVFDIYYNNTAEVTPTVITGDMHALNKINFALMYCFGPRLEIRFTNLQAQLKHLYRVQLHKRVKTAIEN